MVLYGADTEQLRQLAENYRSCAQRMLETSGRLTATITSVTWEGPDADGFRQQWSALEAQLRSSGETITERGADLERHAEEQDHASSSASDRASDLIYRFRDGFGDVLGGLRDFFGDALDSLSRSADAGAAIGQDDAVALMAPGRVTPEDFDKERGADSSTDEAVLTLPDGTKIAVSTEGDGTQTFSMNDPVKLEQKGKIAGLEVKHEVEIGNEFEVTVNPDGTLTYTFTGSSSQTYGASEKNKYVDGEISTSTTSESVYSVTVPPGTSFTDAIAINPFNPASIPPDGSVTVGTGVEQSTNLGVTGKYRGLEVGLGIEETVGSEWNSVISRDGDGNLSMLTGPTNMVRNDGTVSVGVEGAAFELGTSRAKEHGVLEYVEFSGDDAGNKAYNDVLWSDGYPKDTTADGVLDRYTQTHTSTSSESSIGFKIDDVLDVSRNHNTFADEVIHRSYPDGREEWAQQILPHGEGSGNSVYVHGGTGRETEYQMTLGDRPAGDDSGYGDEYWGGAHQGGDLVMSFTQDELNLMRENYAGYKGNPDHFSNETDYLAAITASASGSDSGAVLNQFITHYNYRALEGTMWDHENPVHPEIRVPGRMN